MNRRIFPLLAALALAGAAGCTEDRFPLEIQSLCAPTTDCTFSATCDAQYIGNYKVLYGNNIVLFAQVGNLSPNNEDLATGRVNTNDAHITGVRVDFTGALVGSYTPTIATQSVPAGGTAVISITLPTFYATVTGVTTATINLLGYYDNGREFDTGEFPLDVIIMSSLGSCPAGTIQFCPSNTPATAVLTQIPANCG